MARFSPRLNARQPDPHFLQPPNFSLNNSWPKVFVDGLSAPGWFSARGFLGARGYGRAMWFQGGGTVSGDVPGETPGTTAGGTPAATVVKAGRAYGLCALGLAVLAGGAF